MFRLNGLYEDHWGFPHDHELIYAIRDAGFLVETGHLIGEYRPGDDDTKYMDADDAVYKIKGCFYDLLDPNLFELDGSDDRKKWVNEHDLVVWCDSSCGIRVYWCDISQPEKLESSYRLICNQVRREYKLPIPQEVFNRP